MSIIGLKVIKEGVDKNGKEKEKAEVVYTRATSVKNCKKNCKDARPYARVMGGMTKAEARRIVKEKG